MLAGEAMEGAVVDGATGFRVETVRTEPSADDERTSVPALVEEAELI